MVREGSNKVQYVDPSRVAQRHCVKVASWDTHFIERSFSDFLSKLK